MRKYITKSKKNNIIIIIKNNIFIFIFLFVYAYFYMRICDVYFYMRKEMKTNEKNVFSSSFPLNKVSGLHFYIQG